MDGVFDAQPLPSATFKNVRIDDIDVSGDDMRRTSVPAIKNAALTASIARRGVLQPVGLRPLEPPVAGKHYRVAFGRRRIACAREAGLTTVPAHVAKWSETDVEAITKVENMVRAEPHDIDRWCAVSGLVDAGYTIAEAAAELGLDPAESGRMERLGRLHPELLALAEIHMPQPGQLRVIANAPRKVQAQAAKGRGLVNEVQGRKQVDWTTIAQRCVVTRIPQRHAIFDTEKHAALFTEDLFAQPGDPDAIATDQVTRFMDLQRKALAARVEEQRAAGRRVLMVDPHPKTGLPLLPKSYDLISTLMGQKPKRIETVFTTVKPNGAIAETLAVDVAARKAEEKRLANRRKAAEDIKSVDAVDTGDARAAVPQVREDVRATVAPDATPDPYPGEDSCTDPTSGLPRVTKAAQDIIARAKTLALRKRLVHWAATADTDRVLALMILTLCAENIEIHPSTAKPIDLAAELVGPGGVMMQFSDAALRVMAASAMASMLTIEGPKTGWRQGSGDPAEWIGAAIGAGDALERFDTPEFLAEMPMVALKDLRKEAKVGTWIKTAAELREALVGRLPDWRPQAAAFGAPAPTRIRKRR